MGNATAGVKEILAIRSFDLVSELNKIALGLSFEP